MSTPTEPIDNGSLSSAAIGWVTVSNTETGNLTQVRYDQFVKLLFKADTRAPMLNHAALGVYSKAEELAIAIKKEVHYNKPPDLENIIEELGDLRFYIQAVMNMYAIDEQTVLQYNARKLEKRYQGLKYSDQAAINRADKTGE